MKTDRYFMRFGKYGIKYPNSIVNKIIIMLISQFPLTGLSQELNFMGIKLEQFKEVNIGQ